MCIRDRYATGKGPIAIFISSIIIGILLAQAFSLSPSQGFYMYSLMEVITWILGIISLYRKPKEFAVVLGLSIVIAFLFQSVMPYFG